MKRITPRQAARLEQRKLKRAGLTPEIIAVIMSTNQQTLKLFAPRRIEP
jgi:hypothetical protein